MNGEGTGRWSCSHETDKNERRKMEGRRHEWTAGDPKEGREGTACRRMRARKRGARMNEGSDSCFSSYKGSAAMCLLSANTVG